MRINHLQGKIPGIVVCIHGNSSSSSIFDTVLGQTNFHYSAIIIELPGHGKTVLKEEFSIRGIITNLKVDLASIKEPVFLFGHSLGGHLAIEIAPVIKNLKGLCIMGTPPIELPINLESAFNPVQEMTVLFEDKPDSSSIDAYFKKATINSSIRPRLKDDYLKVAPSVRTSIAAAIPNNHWSNQRAIFNSLNVPKFIAHGLNDPFINLDYLKEIQNENIENCSLKLFDNSGHYPILEVPNDFGTYFYQIITSSFVK